MLKILIELIGGFILIENMLINLNNFHKNYLHILQQIFKSLT